MKILKKLSSALSKERRKGIGQRLLAAFMAVVVFCTTYSLIMPAITLDAATAEAEPGIEAGLTDGETMSAAGNDYESLSAGAEAALVDDVYTDNKDDASESRESGTSAEDEIGSGSEESGLQGDTGTGAEADPVEAETDRQTLTDEKSESEKISETGGEPRQQEHAGKAQTLRASGADYTITAVCSADSGVPAGATLRVIEIEAGSDEYDDCLEEAREAMAEETDASVSASHARFFDITILADGEEIEPEAGVQVSIHFRKPVSIDNLQEVSAVHFGEDGVEVLDTDAKQTTKGVESVSFNADSFSVYGVLYTVDFHWEVDGRMYEFSLPGGGFISFSDLIEVLGVAKTGENEENSGENSDIQFPTEVPGVNDQDTSTEKGINNYILDGVEVSEETRKFVEGVEKVEFSSPELVWVGKIEEESTVGKIKEEKGLEVQYSAELTEEQIAEINAQTVQAGDWALISMLPFDTEESLTVTMKNGESFRIKVTDDNDPLGLNGRTFSIVTIKNGTDGHALQSSVHTTKDFRGYYLTSLGVNINDSTQYIKENGVEYSRQDATAWKFEYNAEKQAYYISNNGKYLYIDPTITSKNGSADHSLNLVDSKDQADEGTLITITKDSNGNYTFGNKNGTLLWDYGNGYWLSNPNEENDNEKLSSVIHLCLPENPYGSHKATLTAAKDLANGQTTIIYQKIWNNTTDEYEFYAIDGNGKLHKVWESSDSLYWKEDLSIEWKLIELTNDDGTPTGYLQFYNEKTKTYLAPKSDGSGYAVVHGASSLTEGTMKTVSISLPGRDGGEYSSKIATWDYDDNTTYGMSLKYDPANSTEPYILEVKELLQSAEFLFAVRDPLVQKQLTTVDTVDSASKGIKISMYDFNATDASYEQRLQYMTDVIGMRDWASGVYRPNIMGRTLGADGFPVSNYTHQTLKNVFYPPAGAANGYYINRQVDNANHLFLQSVYDSTGYYYYSCFDNFAFLPEGTSNFRVYEQVGTPHSDTTNFFYQRGNFMPFNDLDPTQRRDNLYVGEQQNQQLDNADPRKNEDLYITKGRDYFFGMIMETKFQQGPNGLSDQGDPMIFEFNGDDDLWVYADGVLLLDIGGVHDAFHGKINFQTGKIHVDGQNSGDEDTYIKEQYWQAHKFPDGTDWTNRDDPKQNEFFTNGGEENGKLKGTYLDYSTHDLKMFYMERGAGASNLQIQFNLPVITGDEFRVTKNMLTTATGQPIQSAYADAAFYYKAYIKQGENWVEYKKSDFPANKKAVYADDPTQEVVWKEIINPETGEPTGQYSDTIFEVKPGQTAIIPVASSGVEYKVVEVEPEPGRSRMLENFNVTNSDQDPTDSKSTTGKTVKRRGQVFFDNKPVDDIVNELRITKNLHGDLYRDNSTNSKYVEDQNGSPYFEYKIFLESTSGELVPYSLGEYYQIDGASGKYVYYDKGERLLAEVTADGKYQYTYPKSGKATEILSEPKITEHTSQNGSLGDIRPGDTIIVKGLVEGTDFVVDERLDRTHMTATNEGDWNNKYYYSHTDVENAMVRNGNEPTEETKPNNYQIAGDLFDKPVNADTLSVSDKAARGTIVANKNAEVVVHNEVYNSFELPIEKNWSDDFNMNELDGSEVTFTLKRVKLEDRKGSFTLNATANGYPDGFDPEYVFTNTDTGETVTVRFSDMSGSGTARSKTFNLPIGTYTVTYGNSPAGYDVVHTPSSGSVTVTTDNSTSGAAANPNTISLSSVYTQQSGSIKIVKNLTGYHGNNSFENFTATYAVTDTAGREVKNTSGETVNSVTLQYSNFSSGKAEITFDNLPAGQYLVRETIAGSSYNNDKYTVINTADPESGIVTVAKGDPALVTYTSTYTEVKSNPVAVKALLSNIWNNEVKTLYNNTTSFRPGDQVVITFVHQNNNIGLRYRINNGGWTAVPTTGNGGSVTDEIRMTVPDSGITIEFQDDWTQLKADDVNVIKEQAAAAGLQSAQGGRSNAPVRMIKGAPRRAAANTAEAQVENTAPMPEPADTKKMYNPDSWTINVTMKGDGKLYDASGKLVGTVNIKDNKWSANLKGADFDGLIAADEDGNNYYYYIASVNEKNVPDGTTPTITLDASGKKLLYSDGDKGTDKVLSVSNQIIIANKEIKIVKVVKGTSTPVPGAGFTLTKVDEEGHDIEGAEAYTSGELQVDSNTGVLLFTGLKPGIYKLEETKVPGGYIKNEGPYYIIVNSDGSSSINGTLTGTHLLIEKQEDGGFKVENTPGAALPNTGGPGTTIIYLLGIMMLAIAGGGFVMCRKRRTTA